MATSDDLISAVIIVILLFVGWFLIQYNSIDNEENKFSSMQLSFEQERLSSDLGELLSVTEPISGMPLSRLVAGAVTARGEVIDLGYGKTVNSKEYLGEVFDALYGEENYYLKATMPISNLSINFIMDGSGTMEDDLELLLKTISGIESAFKDKYDIELKLYIMWRGADGSGTNNFFCSSIESKLPKGIKCDDTLLKNEDPHNSNTSLYGRNNFKYLVNNPSSNYFIGLKGYQYEDWGTGVAAVAQDLNKNFSEKIENEENFKMEDYVVIIIPFSDELSTGSEASKCFTSAYSAGLKRTHCLYCLEDADANEQRFIRSKNTVEHALTIVKPLNYFVFPILTSLDYKPSTNFCDPNGDPLSPDAGGTECRGKNNCPNYPNEGLFNTQKTVGAIKEHMNLLANETNGTFINLSQGYNGEKLKIALIEAVNHALLSFEIGTKKNEERFAISRVLPMGNGNVAEISFWVYKKREHVAIQNIPSFNSKPFAIMDVNVVRGKVPFAINFDSSNSFDPDEPSKDVNVEWFFDDESISKKRIDDFIVNESGDHNLILRVFDTNNSNVFSENKILVSDRNAELTLFFVGVNLDNSNLAELNSKANFLAKLFRDDIGLESYKLDVYSYPTINCSITGIGSESNLTGVNESSLTQQLENCWISSGRPPIQDNQRLIGLSKEYLGTIDNMGRILVIAPRNQNNVLLALPGFGVTDSFIMSHAMGYTYGLCSEYSINKWLVQNSEVKCPNQFPNDCNIQSINNCNNFKVSPVNMFCNRNETADCIPLENYLTCPLWNPCIKTDERDTQQKQSILVQKYLDDSTYRPGNCAGPIDSGLKDCGDLVVDQDETPANCPQDVLSVSCPALLDNGNSRSIMGVLNGMNGSQTLLTVKRKFDNSSINWIKNKIEENK